MLCLLHLFANQRSGLEGSHGAAIVQDIRPSTQQPGLTTGHLMLDVPFWQGNLHCCKLQRAATTLQVQSSLPIAPEGICSPSILCLEQPLDLMTYIWPLNSVALLRNKSDEDISIPTIVRWLVVQSFCRGHVVKCWYLSVKRAVHVIQRAWRTFLRRNRGIQPTIKQPPNTINVCYLTSVSYVMTYQH
jgi:hypothetical protein